MRKCSPRSIIYPKDVQNITGKGYLASYRMLQKVREALNKPPGSLVSIRDFCRFTGLDEDDMKELIE